MPDTAPSADTPLARLQQAEAAVRDSGRPDAVARQHSRGRMTARERIAALLDAGSFVEQGMLVGPARETAENAGLHAPADGVVTGWGRIDGRAASVVAHDFTVAGGSTGKHGAAKNHRAITTATERGQPLVLLCEGGGHRIQDGQDSRHFAAGSQVFQMLSRHSGWAPIACVILGSGFAGPTNYAAFADLVVMIRGQSAMGMAGPALVKAGTGETIDQESLGGAAMQADKHGIADLAVDSEAEALEAVRRFLSYLPANAKASLPVQPCDDPANRRDPALADLVPADQRQAYDVRKVVAAIADHDSLFELKPGYARNIVTAFARLDGRPVGFVANQPLRRAGMLDTPACEKAARFIALCDAYGIPLVTLIDVPGFAIGSAAEASGLGRRSGRLLFEMGNATVPRVSIVLRKGYGAGYIAMGGGRSFDVDAAIAWPTAEICAMSIEGAIDVAYRRDYESAADPTARRAELIADARERIDVLRAADGFGIDAVIDPRDTRQFLIDTFAACPRRRESRHPPKHRTLSPI